MNCNLQSAICNGPRWAIALLLYIALTLAMMWPLPTRWTTDLPGGAHKDGLEDGYQNVWNLWWMNEALSRPTNPLISDRFFYPERPNLYYHTLSPINTALAAPVTALWGPIAGFNAVAFASFVLGALGAWWLAHDRTGSAGAALLAGIIYAFSPFHMAALVEDGQLQIVALHWLPFYVLFLLRVAEVGRRRDILLAGLFLALTGWTDWYYTLFLLLFTAGYAGWRLCAYTHDWGASRVLLARLGAIGAIFALGAAPLLVPMLIEAAQFDYMNRYSARDPERLSVDLLAYVLPARLHPWWGAAPWRWGVPIEVNRRFYLGGLALALALVGVWRCRPARGWGMAALVFGALSLGPTLHVGGIAVEVPLPYRLLAHLPLVRLSRQPDRFDVLVTLALAVMAAYGARALLDRLAARTLALERRPIITAEDAKKGRRPTIQNPLRSLRSLRLDYGTNVLAQWRQSVAIGLLGALLALDYLAAPIGMRRPIVPPFFAALPNSDDGALLEFPFHDNAPYRDAERMLFQTIHGRPISGGYHSRLYPQPQLGLPVLRDLGAGRVGSDIAAEPGGWPAALNTLNYRYIIGYKQQPLGPLNLAPAQIATFRALVEQGLGVTAPDYEDAFLIAYRVPAATPGPVVQIRAGWGAVEAPPNRRPHRWLEQQGQLGLFVPTAGVYRLCWAALPAGGPRTLVFTFHARRTELPIAATERRYELLLKLPAGATLVDIRSLEPTTTGEALDHNGDLRPISVRFSDLRLEKL